MHRARAICKLLCALLLVQLLSAQSSTGGLSLGARERQRVLEKAIADLRQYYFDQDVALKTVNALLAHEQAGGYNEVTDGQAFANLLARHLIDASHDVHFTVECTRNVFPDFSKPPPPEAQARYQAAMEQASCTFEKVEIRPNNLGYIKLNSFPDVAACHSKAESTMNLGLQFVKPGSRPNLLQSAALGSASYRSANVCAAKVRRSLGNVLGCLSQAWKLPALVSTTAHGLKPSAESLASEVSLRSSSVVKRCSPDGRM